jgi:hypothetical protein
MQMNESQLREMTARLLGEIDQVLDDEPQRAKVAAELHAALALPAGSARAALVSALASDRAVRRWVGGSRAAVHTALRSGPIAGASLPALGRHMACPAGDYDCVLESEETPAGDCPTHGVRLVPAPEP